MRIEDKSRQKIAEEAKKSMENSPPSHDWYHIARCYGLAKNIGQKEDADMDVLLTATILHDIGRNLEDRGKIENHAAWGAKESRKILEDRNKSSDFISKVSHCIKSHRYSREPEPESLEAKILSDIDILDSMGMIEVARTFSYDGENNIPLIVPEDLDETYSGLYHLEERVMNMKNRVYSESALDIAKKREKRVKTYIEDLKEEVTLGLK